jgi:hypothetical protein
MLAAVASTRIGAPHLALALFCLAASAQAVEVEPGACPAPGTVIVTSLGTTLTFEAQEGLVCSLTSSADGRYQTFGLVTLVNSMNYVANKDMIARLWPLVMGKRVTFNAARGSYEWIADYTVVEKKDITVKAGRFPVYVVKYEETQTSLKTTPSHSGIYHSIWTFYISTDLGFFVKMDYESISGGPSAYYPHTPWEAVLISAPK